MAKNNAQTINHSHSTEGNGKAKNFDLVVDGVPYRVKSVPFTFNDELRFRITLNETSEYVFTWDPQIHLLRPINDDSSVLPAGLEEALSEKLYPQL